MSDHLRDAWARLLELVTQLVPATAVAWSRSDFDIAAAEAALSLTFGDELTTWFELVNDTPVADAELLPMNNLINLDRAVAQTLRSRDVWRAREPRNDHDDLTLAGTPTWTFQHEYVYVGTDGMGGGLFVDLRRGPLHGCVRWWDKVEADARRTQPLATGLTDLLEAILSALTTGEPVQGWIPTVTDEGSLTWDEMLTDA